MEGKEVIENIRTAIGQVQASGKEFVNIPSLYTYLDELEKAVPTSLQTAEFQHQSNLEWYKAVQQSNLEMFRSVITTGQTALRTSLLINGGATIAVLTFLGNMRTHLRGIGLHYPLEEPLVNSLVLFGFGVLLGAIATGTTYLSQSTYHHGWVKSGHGFLIATVCLVIATYFVFGFGLLTAKGGFLK